MSCWSDSLTHSLTHSPTHPLTHPPTHPLTSWLTHYRAGGFRGSDEVPIPPSLCQEALEDQGYGQVKPSQAKPAQPNPTQPNPMQAKPSLAKPSLAKPCQVEFKSSTLCEGTLEAQGDGYAVNERIHCAVNAPIEALGDGHVALDGASSGSGGLSIPRVAPPCLQDGGPVAFNPPRAVNEWSFCAVDERGHCAVNERGALGMPAGASKGHPHPQRPLPLPSPPSLPPTSAEVGEESMYEREMNALASLHLGAHLDAHLNGEIPGYLDGEGRYLECEIGTLRSEVRHLNGEIRQQAAPARTRTLAQMAAMPLPLPQPIATPSPLPQPAARPLHTETARLAQEEAAAEQPLPSSVMLNLHPNPHPLPLSVAPASYLLPPTSYLLPPTSHLPPPAPSVTLASYSASRRPPSAPPPLPQPSVQKALRQAKPSGAVAGAMDLAHSRRVTLSTDRSERELRRATEGGPTPPRECTPHRGRDLPAVTPSPTIITPSALGGRQLTRIAAGPCAELMSITMRGALEDCPSARSNSSRLSIGSDDALWE